MKAHELDAIYKTLLAIKKATRITPASSKEGVDQAIQYCKDSAFRQNAYFSDESENLVPKIKPFPRKGENWE